MKNKGFVFLVVSLLLMFLTSHAYAKGPVSKNPKTQGYLLCKYEKSWKTGNANNKYKNKDKGHYDNKNAQNKKPAAPPKVQVRVTSVSLSKSSLSLHVGEWERLTAIVSPQNAAIKKVAWVSEQPWIARVNPSGKITGLRPGTTRVYVVTQDGYKKAYCTVKVEYGDPVDDDVLEISLNKSSTTLAIGETERLRITAENGTVPAVSGWYSVNPNIASVDQTGLVKAKNVGTTFVFVVTKNGYASYCKVTVVSSDESDDESNDSDDSISSIRINQTTSVIALKEGTRKRLTVTTEPDDADITMTWKTSDADIVKVDRYGYITGIDEGTATITAESSDGEYTDTCEVSVIPDDEWERVTSVRLNLSRTTIPVGFTENLKYTVLPSDASDKEVTWTSSNSSVAAVDIWGKVEAKRAGTTTIRATSVDGRKVASCVVTVTNSVDEPDYGILLNKVSSTLYEGEKDYPEVYLFPDQTKITALTWDSSDADVATVSSAGVVTAIDTGTTVITATTSDNKTASYVVKVISR